MAGEPVDRLVVAAREIADVGALDLDDACTEVGQLTRGEWRRDRLLQRDDGEAIQEDSCAVPFVVGVGAVGAIRRLSGGEERRTFKIFGEEQGLGGELGVPGHAPEQLESWSSSSRVGRVKEQLFVRRGPGTCFVDEHGAGAASAYKSRMLSSARPRRTTAPGSQSARRNRRARSSARVRLSGLVACAASPASKHTCRLDTSIALRWCIRYGEMATSRSAPRRRRRTRWTRKPGIRSAMLSQPAARCLPYRRSATARGRRTRRFWR